MIEPVKPKRRYDSPRRREQAAATRRAILEAAQRLFEQQGYAATTMAAIAAEAGVALKTVYVAFETKSGVLRALWHLLLRGDEDDVPVGERDWYREVLEEPDPERQLRLNARNSRVVKERVGRLLDVIRGAAAADPDIGDAVGAHPGRLLRQPARDRGVARRRAGAAPRPRRRPRDRHPVDAQPPGPVAAAGRPARLDARRVRALVRRHRMRATPSLRVGSGPPLVLLHGFIDTWRTWELVLPALERHHEVLAPTLAGHSGGPPIEGAIDDHVLADAVERALDEAGFERAHIAGNSLGGYVALQLAARDRAAPSSRSRPPAAGPATPTRPRSACRPS